MQDQTSYLPASDAHAGMHEDKRVTARDLAAMHPNQAADLRRLVGLVWRVWGEPHAYAEFHLAPIVGLLPGELALRYLREAKNAPDVLAFSKYPLRQAGRRERVLAWLSLQTDGAETKAATPEALEKTRSRGLEEEVFQTPVQVSLQLDRGGPVAISPPINPADLESEPPTTPGLMPGDPVPPSGWPGSGYRTWGGCTYRRQDRAGAYWMPQNGFVRAEQAPGGAAARPVPRSAAGGPVLGLAPAGGGCYLGGAPHRKAAE